MNSLNPEYKWVTKLSSAGLVYYHFGHRLVGQILNKKPDDKITKIIYNKVYEMFVEEVDAKDNGIDVAEGKPRYMHLYLHLPYKEICNIIYWLHLNIV